MSKRQFIGIISAALALGSSGCNVEQPRPDCTVARGPFAARYTLREGPVSGACREKRGEIIALDKYNPAIQTPDGPKQDATRATLALRTQTLGELDASDHPLVSLGSYSITPDANEICTAPQLSKAEQHVPASGTSPAVDIVYEWSDVRVLNRPDALGTQVAATLKYTEGGCTATYDVLAVWPMVHCENEDGEADDRLCSAEPDPSAGMTTGSGINPRFPVECHDELKLCVLVGSFPAFKK